MAGGASISGRALLSSTRLPDQAKRTSCWAGNGAWAALNRAEEVSGAL